MNEPRFYDQNGEDQPLAVKMRPGLKVERVLYRSEPWWIVKDPFDQKYHRYNEHEYAILSWLDGEVSFTELRERFEKKFSPFRTSFREITSLLREFFKQSVIVSTRGDNGVELHDYAREKRRKQVQQKAKSLLGIKFRGWDPSRFIDATYPLVGWCFSRVAVAFTLLFVAAAFVWLLIHSDQFAQRLPSLWTLLDGSNLLPLAITISVTKVLHELGHAYVHKRHGGECHEIGVMIFFFVPTLYCNTSDSWMMADKWKRMAIGAAGVYVEAFLFSVATFTWWFSAPGLVQDIGLNLMVICSISAALTNGNPLMKYDGYFVLSDWLEMPNLAQLSGKEVRRVFLRHGLGIEKEVDHWTSDSNKRVLVAYGLASFAYKVLLISAISFLMVERFRFAGLIHVGLLIGLVSIASLFIAPIKSIWQYFKQPGNRRHVRRGRAWSIAGGLTALLAAAAFAPLPYYASAECTIDIAGQQTVFAPFDARIEKVFVRPGERVDSGQPLIKLASDELDERLLDIESQRIETELKLSLLRTPKQSEDQLTGNTESLGGLAASLAKLKAEMRVLAAQRDALLVRAPRDGYVFGVAIGERLASTDDQSLNYVHGNPLSRRNLGALLQRSDEICHIGDTAQREITLLIKQQDNSIVREGQPVTVMLTSLSRRLSGEIQTISLRENRAEDLPAAIYEQSASPMVSQVKLAANADKRTDIEFKDGQTLSSSMLQATAHLTDAPGDALTYASVGKARIYVGDRTLLWRGKRVLEELLQRVQ